MLDKSPYEATLQTVISGSFRKHLHKIGILKKVLESEGVGVLSPEGLCSVNPGDEFVVLDSDPVSSPELLQPSIFAKMRRSTFLVVANFDGYLGNATLLEIGYAVAIGLKIYCLEEVKDPNLIPFCVDIERVFPELKKNLAYELNLAGSRAESLR